MKLALGRSCISLLIESRKTCGSSRFARSLLDLSFPVVLVTAESPRRSRRSGPLAESQSG